MKKIGIFLESEPHSGGTFQYNQTMLDALAALPRERFTVVAGFTSELWLEYLKPYDVKTVAIPRSFLSRALGFGWMLFGLPMGVWRRFCPLFHPMAKVMLKEQCDLWVFPSQDARSFQIPVTALVTVLDLMHRYERRFPEAASHLQYWLRERLYSNIGRYAKGILVDAEIGRQHVMESYGTPKTRIHVLPFIAPAYMRSPGPPPGFESRYKLPGKFLFYPAQFWMHKNHRNLLQAIASLKSELPDMKLVLSGSKKNAYESVAELVQGLDLADAVIFLGYVPDVDMAELYRRARALVMPTYYGPTNIPPMEAFTAGCPVAISGIYGMPEQAGDAALLFDPDSIAEIADCIRRLWTDDHLCKVLSDKGMQRAMNWGPEQFNETVLKIVDMIVCNKGANI